MIFHTAADKKYYDYFFKNWHQSIIKHNLNSKFSLTFIGDVSQCDVVEYCKENSIILKVDNTSLDDIILKYDATGKDALGYYALSRWLTIPNDGNDVCMTDVDLINFKPFDFDIKEDFKNHHFISISRKKEDHSNMMMVLILRSDIINEVKNRAAELLEKQKLNFALDTKVLTWMIFERKMSFKEYNSLHRLDYEFKRYGEFIFGYFGSKKAKVNGVVYEDGVNAKVAKYKNFFNKISI